MSGGSVQITGLSDLNAVLLRMTAQVSRATRVATTKAAHLVEGEIKKTLTTSSHRRGTPTPSSPGEPPSLITGRLRRSISVKGPRPFGIGNWEAEVTPTAVYGRIQELGGVTGRHHATELPPRPYVTPSYEKALASGAIAAVYVEAWRAAMSR